MVGSIFYDDKDYSVKAEWCNNNNCHIEEIEPDENGRRYTIVENVITEVDIANNKLQELTRWFDVDYARKEQKYRRLYTLKQKCDDGADPYEKLVNLYAEAEINRKEIQRLEELLNG